jgi:hypothetical protein
MIHNCPSSGLSDFALDGPLFSYQNIVLPMPGLASSALILVLTLEFDITYVSLLRFSIRYALSIKPKTLHLYLILTP